MIGSVVDELREVILKMALKAINHTAGSTILASTLIVSGEYPRIIEKSSSSPIIIEEAIAVEKAIKETRSHHAKRQVADTPQMRNDPNARIITRLLLKSETRVHCDREGWTG